MVPHKELSFALGQSTHICGTARTLAPSLLDQAVRRGPSPPTLKCQARFHILRPRGPYSHRQAPVGLGGKMGGEVRLQQD